MEFFATSNGIPVHISDTEKGDIAILLLHGYLETLYVWEELTSYFLDNYRIISIDLPGHGLSGTHPQINSMEFCADTIKGVLDKCGVVKCFVAGHSLGSYIAIEFQKKYPEMVQGLIMVNSHTLPDPPDSEVARQKEIHFITSGRLLTLASIAIPNMFKKENLRELDDIIQEVIEIAETHDPEGIAASVRGMMSREDNTQYLSEVKVPVLAFFGDSDNFFPLDDIRHYLTGIPNVESHIVENCGHNSHLESPEFVAGKISEFITRESC